MMVISLAERYGSGQNRRGDLVLLLLDEALPKRLVGRTRFVLPRRAFWNSATASSMRPISLYATPRS